MHISKDGDLITLINVFDTTPEQQQALIDQWVRFTEEVSNEPGYVGTALHKSTDGTRVINYAHWRSQADFDAFLEEALLLRNPSRPTLSAQETKLIRQINRGLPVDLRKRYAQLSGRQKKGTLTATEHKELLKLTHEAESRDADRAAALVELAKLRRLPVRTLMTQMGIKAPPIHG